MRPRTLDDIVGQDHLLAGDAPFRRALRDGRLHACILWGPPGTGKTTLARCLAAEGGFRMVVLSAVLSGVKDLKEAIDTPSLDPRPLLLFVDEIHRWNKAQQDALLPHVESGRLTLVGATTENPAFHEEVKKSVALDVLLRNPLFFFKARSHYMAGTYNVLMGEWAEAKAHFMCVRTYADALVRLFGGRDRDLLRRISSHARRARARCGPPTPPPSRLRRIRATVACT